MGGEPDFRELLAYDPETGIFRWKVGGPGHAGIGEIAGDRMQHGYWRICVKYKRYLAHRLAWWFVKGVWPEGRLDHRDLDRSNNRFSNLRLASHSQNMVNCKIRSHNTSGYRGVTWHAQGKKWCAEIRKDGRHIHIALCDSPEEAHALWLVKAHELYGDFIPSHGLTSKE